MARGRKGSGVGAAGVEVLSLEAVGEALGRALVALSGGDASDGITAPRGGRAAGSGVRAGEVVRYRQGRGEAEAKVVSVDKATGMALLARTADGKRVERRISALIR